jgi:hypothetical protein
MPVIHEEVSDKTILFVFITASDLQTLLLYKKLLVT